MLLALGFFAFDPFVDVYVAPLIVFTHSSPHSVASPPISSLLSSFSPATESEVARLLQQSPNKQCNLDPILTALLKECASLLIPTITSVTNHSLATGLLPTHFKQSFVSPLLKKTSLDKESLSNYRPISNLSLISKLTERIVKSRLTAHLSANSLFNPN
jgi:hypothetical protein